MRGADEQGLDCGGVCAPCIDRVTVAPDGAGAQGSSISASASADGSVVVFDSDAANLVPGGVGGAFHAFARDRATGVTTQLTTESAGGPSITPDGAFIAFVATPAGRPATAYRYARATAALTIVSDPAMGVADGEVGGVSISSDGQRVCFATSATNLAAGDTNGTQDLYLRDLERGTTERVSLAVSGAQLAAAVQGMVDPSGRFVLMYTDQSLVAADTNTATDLYVRELATGEIDLASVTSTGAVGDSSSALGTLSDGGRYVAFVSTSDLVLGPTIGTGAFFLRDRTLRTTERLDLPEPGVEDRPGNFWRNASISRDGRYVSFVTSRLMRAGDSLFFGGLFVRDRLRGTTTRVDLTPEGEPGDGGAAWGVLSPDGRTLTFVSGSTNLVPGDYHAAAFYGDVFVARGLW